MALLIGLSAMIIGLTHRGVGLRKGIAVPRHSGAIGLTGPIPKCLRLCPHRAKHRDVSSEGVRMGQEAR
jgi:hypothetical protein